MTCEELLRLLDTDGLAGSQPAVEHLEHCAACRAAVEQWRSVRHELRGMSDEPVPPFLHARIMAHVRAAQAEPRRWWQRVPRATWAGPVLVSAVLVAAGGYGLWRVMRPAAAPLASTVSLAVAPAPPQPKQDREAPAAPLRDASALKAEEKPAPALEKATQRREQAAAHDKKVAAAASLPETQTATSSGSEELQVNAGAPEQASEARQALNAATQQQGQIALSAQNQNIARNQANAIGGSQGYAQTQTFGNTQNAAQGLALGNEQAPSPARADRTQQAVAPQNVPSEPRQRAALDQSAPDRLPKETETDRFDEAVVVSKQRVAAAATATVACELVASGSQAQPAPLSLPASLAPAAGTRLFLTVSASGAVVVTTAGGAPVSRELRHTLTALKLAPGSYVLRRAVH